MMTNPCYPENLPIYGMDPNSSNPTSFMYNLSVLKDKVEEVQSVASILGQHPEMAISTVGTLIQEIMVTASSMMFACQQMSLVEVQDHKTAAGEEAFSVDHWYGESYCNNEIGKRERDTMSYEVIEVEAAELLAKYTHYCQVCGKGFKRDANLRMHMRAHGDEYKSSAALTNPAKSVGEGPPRNRKYSCPQEGCRWNKKHARFQPLKSMICVKNHYKRSHCPKMYVCKRCTRKQFSVLSDLRTHEKHCGHLKWRCSCGTTFSRKDKLMGHVALFLGHAPAPLHSPHFI